MTRTAVSHSSLLLVALATTLAVAAPAQAGLVFVSSRAALGGNDSLNWGAVGPTGMIVTQTHPNSVPEGAYDPVTLPSANGIGVTLNVFSGTNNSIPDFNNIYSLPVTISTLNGLPSITTFEHTTAGSAALLFVTLNFAQPVVGFGVDLFINSHGPFWTFEEKVFDTNNQQIGGLFVGSGTPSQVTFFDREIESTGVARIKSVQWSIRTPASFFAGENLDIAINRLDLVTTGGSPSAVPEPSGIVLVAVGALTLGSRRLFRQGSRDRLAS